MTLIAPAPITSEIYVADPTLAEIPTAQLELLPSDQITMANLTYPVAEAVPLSDKPDAIAARRAAIAAAYLEQFRAEDAQAHSGSLYRSTQPGELEVVKENVDFDSIFKATFESWHAEDPAEGWDTGSRQMVAGWVEADKGLEQDLLAKAAANVAVVETIIAERPAEEAKALLAAYGTPVVYNPEAYPLEIKIADPPGPSAAEILDTWAREEELERLATIYTKPAAKNSPDPVAAENSYVDYERPAVLDPADLSPQAFSDLYRELRKERLDELQAGRNSRLDRWEYRKDDKREADIHATWVLTGHRTAGELPELGGVTHLLPPSDSWRARFYHLLVRTPKDHDKPVTAKKIAAVRAKVADRIDRIPLSSEPKVAIPEIIGSAVQSMGTAMRWVKGRAKGAFWASYKQTVGRMPIHWQQSLPWAVGAAGVVAVAALTPFVASQTVPAQIPFDDIADGVVRPGNQ